MLFLSYLVSSPLLKMAVIARAMAKGDFSVKPSLVSGDEIGELAGALAHLSDEIQEKIETIKEEAAKLDAVLCSMSEGVMVSDEKGEVLLMNPSFRKTFLIEGEPRGRKVWEVVSHRALLEMSEGLISGTATSAGRDVEINVPDERVLKVNAAAVLKDGKFSGAVMVFHDITELKRLEHVRQDFVANVSHELRTPVANIKGYAETLLEGALDDKDSARQFVGIIAENGRRLEDLINDLLDLSKIESGKLPLLFSSLNVAQLIRKAAAILEKNIRDKHLSLEIRIPEDLPRISADEARLMQVFINLIDNAIKYTLAGGSLLIVAEDNERQVRIDVIDTGVGIPERDLPRIFERFYRVEKARSREQGGTGLGLSIVKHIVQAHGGQVWASSAPGQGTTFSFTIPKASVQ
jgi:two-component system phosphate regulon sensor histidine kinase PhoR